MLLSYEPRMTKVVGLNTYHIDGPRRVLLILYRLHHLLKTVVWTLSRQPTSSLIVKSLSQCSQLSFPGLPTCLQLPCIHRPHERGPEHRPTLRLPARTCRYGLSSHACCGNHQECRGRRRQSKPGGYSPGSEKDSPERRRHVNIC
jgi:hypothetical protein